MKKITVIFYFSLICLCNSLEAQLISFHSNRFNRFGFLNKNGDTLHPPVFYTYTKSGVSNYFVAKKGEFYHPMNATGIVDTSICYAAVIGIPNGKAILKKCDTDFHSICDSAGNILFPEKFNYVREGKNAFIADLRHTADNMSFVDKYVFDKNLNFIFKTAASEVNERSVTGNISIFLVRDSVGFRFYNDKGVPLSIDKYDEVGYKDGMPWFTARKGKAWGLVNFKGETLLPFAYTNLSQGDDSLTNISKKLFLTKLNDSTSLFIDLTNSIVNKILFDVEDYSMTGITVSKEVEVKKGKRSEIEWRTSLLSWDGQLLLPFNYDEIRFIPKTNLFLAGLEGVYELYDKSGNKLSGEKLSNVSAGEDYEFHHALVLEDKNYLRSVYDLQTGNTGNVKFSNSDAQYFGDETFPFIYKFETNRGDGLMDITGNKIVDDIYDNFVFLSKSVFYTEKYEKKTIRYSLFDLKRFSVPVIDFDEILSDDDKGNLVVMKKNKKKKEYFEIKKDGRIFSIDRYGD